MKREALPFDPADVPPPAALIELRVVLPASYTPERYRDDAEQVAAFAVALRHAGTPLREILRRMRGYEPRDAYEVSP